MDDLRNVRRVLQNRVNPLQFYSDTEFRNRCHMSKLSFEQLFTELEWSSSVESLWALLDTVIDGAESRIRAGSHKNGS